MDGKYNKDSSSSSFNISRVSIVFNPTGGAAKSATLYNTGNSAIKFNRDEKEKNVLRATVTSGPCALPIRITCKMSSNPFKSKTKEFIIGPEDLSGVDESLETKYSVSKQEWQACNIQEIVLDFGVNSAQRTISPSFYENAASGSESTLIPTTEEIQKICPRFRILLIGKSGVGKTSLINEAFGVRGQVSDDGAGKADIDYEHLSEGNDLFAVHDSQGFEQGEVTKLKTVQDFIERRSKEPELKNQLHVIWLCLEAPAMGNRLLEGGTIEFLSQRSKGSIHVPIVVIFTKFDKLVNEYKIDLMRRKDSDAENHALQKANESIEEYCAKSLRDVAGEDIRYLAVSNKKKYSHRIRQLVELTSEDVYKHVASEPSIMAAMAQRTSIDLKIKQSIEIGKKRYWKALLMGTGFGNTKINDILRVVHIDIVNVWNLENPKNPVESRKTHVNNLIDPRFYNLMFAMVSELGPTTGNDTTSDSLGVLDVGLKIVGTVAGIVGMLSTAAVPIVIPIAVGLVGVQWAYGVYQRTHELQRKFMAYIIDLTYIIYILFVLTLGENGPYRKQPAITRRLIKATYSKYYDSPLKVHVHSKIREYDDNKGPIARVRRDNAFELIEKLLDELLEAGKSSGTQAIDVGEALPQDDDEPW